VRCSSALLTEICIYADRFACTRACANTHMHQHVFTCTHKHPYTHICEHKHSSRHARRYKCAHTLTHTHTHKYCPCFLGAVMWCSSSSCRLGPHYTAHSLRARMGFIRRSSNSSSSSSRDTKLLILQAEQLGSMRLRQQGACVFVSV